MLRVGLTGGLGSGKSTALERFAEHGAYTFSADEIGRAMMQSGEALYAQIVAHFGPSVVAADGSLDRPALARIAFGGGEINGERNDAGRVEELNAIVHPAVIARQLALIDEIAQSDANAIVIVESALIFETKYGGEGGCQSRFDRLNFVQACEDLKIARFIARAVELKERSEEERRALESDARHRLAKQIDDQSKAARCDYILSNDGTIEQLRTQVDTLWLMLRTAAQQ
jgi:dephospho-CoA kinase